MPYPNLRLAGLLLATVFSSASALATNQFPAQPPIPGPAAGTTSATQKRDDSLQRSATEAASNIGIELGMPVRAGRVELTASGTELRVAETWRTLDDRRVRYDLAMAYSKYFCGSSNLKFLEAKWEPGYSQRAGAFVYEDSLGFTCSNAQSIRNSVVSPVLDKPWSEYGAAIWMAPFDNSQDTVKATLRFGTLRPNEATSLIQKALFHAGSVYRQSRCAGHVLLPVLRHARTLPLDRVGADALLEVSFDCEAN